LPVFELIEWYLVAQFDHFIGFVSERSMPIYGISNGLMPKGRLVPFPALLRDGFKPFNDLMSFWKVGLLVQILRQVLDNLPLINPSQLKWGARPHVQSMVFEVVELAQNVHAFILFWWFLHIFSLVLDVRGEREGTNALSDRSSHILNLPPAFFVFAFVSSFVIDYLVKLLLMPKASTPLSSVRICHTKMRRSSIVET
jgi:hypothetical protein